MNRDLPSVDSLEVVVLVDNYTDMFLAEGPAFCRRPLFMPPQTLLAEHGFSCLLKVRKGSTEEVLLLDTGVNPSCLLHNAEILQVNGDHIDAIALSHGHPDHYLGLYGILPWLPDGIPLLAHPDIFLKRRLNNPATVPLPMPALDQETLLGSSVRLDLASHPRRTAAGLILLSGEIERTTSFEKGFAWAEVKREGGWEVDPFRDEQSLIIHVAGKGLVIISGCAHAGIINTIRHAKKITGIDRVHAVLGGFHLTGPLFAPIIQPTIEEMNALNVAYVIPMHCTGWEATRRFKEAMTERCILNTVGSTYYFS